MKDMKGHHYLKMLITMGVGVAIGYFIWHTPTTATPPAAAPAATK